ncbi:hypothetical protein EV382_5365 [Micromonospora violae]|uniref:Uncharacterized protein n=1 Tax=Micromonospora violae TaxID=1278207 RepID=A0A4Q7UKV4_9ACTN|nr:hypothetical protein [Micromonospora violae]RZT82065.1 hypothetical protein EV382_5365 [Micromonospora violae]
MRYYVTFTHTTANGDTLEFFEYQPADPIAGYDDIDKLTTMIRGWGRTNVTVIAFSPLADPAPTSQAAS